MDVCSHPASEDVSGGSEVTSPEPSLVLLNPRKTRSRPQTSSLQTGLRSRTLTEVFSMLEEQQPEDAVLLVLLVSPEQNVILRLAEVAPRREEFRRLLSHVLLPLASWLLPDQC